MNLNLKYLFILQLSPFLAAAPYLLVVNYADFGFHWLDCVTMMGLALLGTSSAFLMRLQFFTRILLWCTLYCVYLISLLAFMLIVNEIMEFVPQPI